MACCNLSKKKGTLMTIALCVVICLSQFQHGVEVGYLNFAVEDINSPSEMNPFHINIKQQSWLTSVAMFGSMAGAILSAPLLSRLERHQVLIASCLPSAIGWLVITCAGSVNTMYAGRIIVGLAQGLAGGTALIYLVEIARPDIRGAISLFSMMGVALGKLFVYVIGDLIAWNWTSLIMIGLTLVVTAGLVSIPTFPTTKNKDEEMKTVNSDSLEGTMQTNNETEYLELENIASCSTDDSFLDLVPGGSNAIDSTSTNVEQLSKDEATLKKGTENELLKDVLIEGSIEDESINIHNSEIQNDANNLNKIPILALQNFGKRAIKISKNLVLNRISSKNNTESSESKIPNLCNRTGDETCNFEQEKASSTESIVGNSLTTRTVRPKNELENYAEKFGTLDEAELISSSLSIGNSEIEEALHQVSSDPLRISAHLREEDAPKIEIPVDDVLNSELGRSIKSGIREVLLSKISGKFNKVTNGSLNPKTANVPNSEKDIALNDDGFSNALSSTSNSTSDNVLNPGAGNESNSVTETALKIGVGRALRSLIGGVVDKVSSSLLNSETTNSEINNASSLILNCSAKSFANAKSKDEQNSALGSVLNSTTEQSLNSKVDNAKNLDPGNASSINLEIGNAIKIENAISLNSEIDGAVNSVIGNTLKSGIAASLNLGIGTTLNLENSSSSKTGIGSDINLRSEDESVLNSIVDRSALNSLTGSALDSATGISVIDSVVSGVACPMVGDALNSVIGKALNFNSEKPTNSVNGAGVISNSVTGDASIDLTAEAGLNSLTNMATNEVNEFVNQAINNIAGEALNSIPGGEAVSGFLETAANSLIGRGIGTIVDKVKQVDDKYAGGKVQVVTGEAVKVLKKVGPNKLLQLVRQEESGENDQKEIQKKVNMFNSPVPWSDLFKKNNAKYLGFCVFLQIVSTMGGAVVLNQYSVTIFKVSRTNLSEDTQTLLLAVIGVVFTIVCSLTIDLMSRKRVALISLLCEGFFMNTLGIYFYVDDYVNHAWAQQYIFWLPLVSFIMFQIFLIWSDATIFVMSAEIFPTDELRGRVSPVLLTCRQLFLFFGAKGFLKLIELIKLCGGFWLCAAINVAGGVFYVFLVPETAKKSFEQIQSELNQESSEV